MQRYRSHLALTVWPLGALFVLELFRLGPALRGSASFALASRSGWLAQSLWTAVALALLGLYVRGWVSLQREGAGPYRTVGCRRLQQWAGAVGWALILGHLAVRWWLFASVGNQPLAHYELLRSILSHPLTLSLYLLGAGAVCLYLSQGVAASIRSAGVVRRPETSRWLEVGCTLGAAVLLLVAANILSHFAIGRAFWFGASHHLGASFESSPTESP